MKSIANRWVILSLLLSLSLAACGKGIAPSPSSPLSTLGMPSVPPATLTRTITAAPTVAPSETPNPTPWATSLPTATPTPFPEIAVEDFDERAAIEALYGDEWVSSGGGDCVRWEPGESPSDSAHSKVRSFVPFQQDGADKYFLLTTTDGIGNVWDLVGGAVFSRVGDRWQVDVAQIGIDNLYGWQRTHIGEMEFVQIGSDEYGMLIHVAHIGTGFWYESAELVTQMGDRLEPIASVEMSGSDRVVDSYTPDYTSTLEFIPGSNSQFYDIRVMTTGNQWVSCEAGYVIMGSAPFEQITIYTFSEEGQRYVLLSQEKIPLIKVTGPCCGPG